MCRNHSFYVPNQAVKEILDTWENMKFTVVKYYKGTQERGYILGSVDEVIQCLDDNTFNLQSISGSRFVGPFLQTVHKWEKTLSLIGEVIEVRGKGRPSFVAGVRASVPFYGPIMFRCVDMALFVRPFMCQGTFGLPPPSGSCDQCCRYEHPVPLFLSSCFQFLWSVIMAHIVLGSSLV